MGRSIKITGEHTIDSIIGQEYGGLSLEEVAEKKALLARLNPHIVSLETFQIGDDFYLEDEEKHPLLEVSGILGGEQEPSDEQEPSGEQEEEIPIDQTVHIPAIDAKEAKKRKK